MADYRNKLAKKLEARNFALLKEWRRTFFHAFTSDDTAELERLSDAVDRLWTLHTRQLARDHRETEDPLPVWGRPDPERAGSANEWKDRIRGQGIFAESTASPYRRLKLVMDYWCALWFWPIARSGDLPSRDEFLTEISLVLTGDVRPPGQQPSQSDLFGEEYAEHAGEMAAEILDEVGILDLEQLFRLFPRLKLVEELAKRHRFHHWELVFADVFYGQRADGSVRGGFDLVVGNPPWVRVRWDEKGVLGEFDPVVAVRKLLPREASKMVEEAVKRDPTVRDACFGEMEATEAMQEFVTAAQNYPLLKGQQSNLYKCFLPQAWSVTGPSGVVGLLHPEDGHGDWNGVYNDPKAAVLRAALYPRLRAHFQFINERRLFPEVHHHTTFSINIYGVAKRASPDGLLTGSVSFTHISNLFAPSTVDACLCHDGRGLVPGIKDGQGQWNVAGHRLRMIRISDTELETFATLYDETDSRRTEARLPALHSGQLVTVFKKLADASALGDLGNDISINYGPHGTRVGPSATARFVATRASRTNPPGSFSRGHTTSVGIPCTRRLGEPATRTATTMC